MKHSFIMSIKGYSHIFYIYIYYNIIILYSNIISLHIYIDNLLEKIYAMIDNEISNHD